jgi:hypothetical protein
MTGATMLDKQRIFNDCVAKYLGSHEQWGVATATRLTDAFTCMRFQLEKAKASPKERSAFIDVIRQAIKSDLALTHDEYAHDKAELQNVLQSAFDCVPYEGTMAPKVSFLNNVRF